MGAGLEAFAGPASSQPKEMEELPPGGLSTRVVGVSVIMLPQFWLLPHAKVLDETRGRAPKMSAMTHTLFGQGKREGNGGLVRGYLATPGLVPPP